MNNSLFDLSPLFAINLQSSSSNDYLSLKRGSLPLAASFHSTYDKSMAMPSLLLNERLYDPCFNLASASIAVQFALNSANAEQLIQDLDQDLVETIIEGQIESVRGKLLSNEGNLAQAEKELTMVMENNRIGAHSFSSNALTGVNTYDLLGNIVDVGVTLMDPRHKQYLAEEEVLQRAPHSIRPRRKKRIRKQQVFQSKSEREVREQFHILNKMLSLDITPQQRVQPNQLLDLVEFSEKADYNDLWSKLESSLSLTSHAKSKAISVTLTLPDQIFQSAITRIMNEATQYQQQTQQDQLFQQQEILQKQQQIKAESQLKQIKVIPQQVRPLQKAKKYTNAIEDETNLLNFYDMLPKESFAIQYPFELDQFQKRAILHLQRKESVFVAAHTSAGKTVVAEYGIALAMRHKRKVIYTSPIKALSNQKYRELSAKFESVGIVTGDVTLNPGAGCVIMTTEILRNNLYRGAEMIRDIEWVVFDEVHYINNAERGVVWEETIIMLPEHVGLIMLSATVPNYMQFANWVGRTKRRTIYVVKTLHRPVPLEHSLYLGGSFHTIKPPTLPFLDLEYDRLLHHIQGLTNAHLDLNQQLHANKLNKIQERGFYNDNRKEQRLKLLNKNAIDKFIKGITKDHIDTADGRNELRLMEQLIIHCRDKKLLPCIVFTFSKKKINDLAGKLADIDLTNGREKSKIKQMIAHALNGLKEEDQQIPQLDFVTSICMKGFAVHHGDLLPIAKELVELLFSEGLIKVLFATETFAMGINMPAKTVIFNSLEKMQGTSMRLLNSSEYVQMSGRAGRRGLDEKGTVVILVKDVRYLPATLLMKQMLDSAGEPLQSKFKVTYQIILNLFTSKDINVQDMMRQSFLEDPKFKELTGNLRTVKQLRSNYEALSQFQCPFNQLGTRLLVDCYTQTAETLRSLPQKYDWKRVGLPRFIRLLGYNLQTELGLLLKVEHEKEAAMEVMVVHETYLGMELTKEERVREEAALKLKKRIVLEYESKAKPINGQVEGTNNKYHYYVYWVRQKDIVEVYSNKVNYRNSIEETRQCFAEIACLLLDPPHELTPVNSGESHALRKDVFRELEASPCHTCALKDQHLYQLERRNNTKALITHHAHKINTNELGLTGSFEGMLATLQQFAFVQDSTLTLKGRIAREVDIYVAQVVVEAILDPLNPPELAALLSAFVCDYKARPKRGEEHLAPSPYPASPIRHTLRLDDALQSTHAVIREMVAAETNNEAYFNICSIEEMVVTVINFQLVDTVYRWAMGEDFVEIKQDTLAPEGTIVRTIMRLSMLLNNLKSVCRLLGSSSLEAKIDEAVDSIKRDIVACQSLYFSV